MVLEIDLHDLIRETEHDGVARSHPLLNVDDVLDLSDFWSLRVVLFEHSLGLIMALEVAPEVLQKSHLLLKLFRVFSECVLLADVLPVTRPPLHIIQMVAIRI